MGQVGKEIRNALTIDVEDYYHVAAFNKVIKPSEWAGISSRFGKNTRHLLDLFDKYEIKATFFVLGWCAERDPELIKEIARQGHEIASHGYSHQLVYTQSQSEFRKETALSKNILEDIVSKPIKGYRAASYSITNKSLWAIDILAELGFEYDSSIFPVVHDRYGIPGSPEEIHKLKTEKGNELLEFPLTVAKIGSLTIPMAGGGYFRLYPYWFTRYFLTRVNRRVSQPFIFYLHPWEIDPGQPKVEASILSTFRHYNNIEVCEKRLLRLLGDFNFTTVENVIADQGDIKISRIL